LFDGLKIRFLWHKRTWNCQHNFTRRLSSLGE